jgi:hypothetical protein
VKEKGQGQEKMNEREGEKRSGVLPLQPAEPRETSWAGVGGLRLPKVLKKHDLTMFMECNTWTCTFGLGSEPQCEKREQYEGWRSAEATRKGASAWQQEREPI